MIGDSGNFVAGDRGLADDELRRHRFEAAQALRQVLARAVAWGMMDVDPAKHVLGIAANGAAAAGVKDKARIEWAENAVE